ncbi:Gfo/Idh/MocA family protein, partial [Bacteroidota bacterium]
MAKKIQVIVIGCGNMGSSHARSYNSLDGFDIVALVDRDPNNREALAVELGSIDQFDDIDTALAIKKPDAVAICTYPDSHATLTEKALK